MYICQHGGACAEHEDDSDGDYFSMVRGVVGPDVPVISTLGACPRSRRRVSRGRWAVPGPRRTDARVAASVRPSDLHSNISERQVADTDILIGFLEVRSRRGPRDRRGRRARGGARGAVASGGG